MFAVPGSMRVLTSMVMAAARPSQKNKIDARQGQRGHFRKCISECTTAALSLGPREEGYKAVYTGNLVCRAEHHSTAVHNLKAKTSHAHLLNDANKLCCM